jgi:hypothetical protein
VNHGGSAAGCVDKTTAFLQLSAGSSLHFPRNTDVLAVASADLPSKGDAMSGPVHGQHFSVRVSDEQARDFDALAQAAGLRRSELLRLVIARTAEGDVPPALLAAGSDLRCARTVNE